MKKDTEALLEARSRRHIHATSLSKDFLRPVVIAKANTPGIRKNTPESKATLNISSALIGALFDIHFDARVESVDGDYHVFVIKNKAFKVKKIAVFLEDTHTLGRLMDLDVYSEGRSISRTELNMQRRQCFICAKPAFVCAREKNHTHTEIKAFIASKVRGFLLDALTREVEHALLKELYLTPCLSLVGPYGSGIHKDMNITHFLASIAALKPYFRHYLAAGVNLDNTFHTLRRVGLQGEKAMFEATDNVNTHKGAHFIFGLALPVFMDSVIKGETFNTFRENLKAMAKHLLAKDFTELKTPTTTGEMLYKTRGIKGIRGEALKGFPGVFEWYPEKAEDGFKKLLRIMARIDDTTLLKRNMDVTEMKKALKSCETEGFRALDEVKEAYRHASPGGAADLLAFVYFLEHTDHLLK